MNGRFRPLPTRVLWIFALVLALALTASACREDDNKSEATHEDKRAILCVKIEACAFEDDLAIDDCVTYAEDLSEWLLQCALEAKGCGDLADCFNIAEGETPVAE